jgi:sugar fermentation stimulation protein A
MIFPEPLVHGRLIKRYKRFLADVMLDTDEIVTAHCTNSGSMKSCLEDHAEVYLTYHKNPKRKTQYTWEMIKINGDWVGINTNHPNLIAWEAVKSKQIPGLDQYEIVKREVKTGNSRIDVYAENTQEQCFIEVKNVTMKEGKIALFPDAVTTRGRKHLKELIRLKAEGIRAVMFYVIQRMDVNALAPARGIDPEYTKTLLEATEAGVEIFAMQTKVTPKSIEIVKKLPFISGQNQ